jgi:SAM-dependent methyltransferase
MSETLDTTKAEAFAERMLGAINDASVVLMTSIGQRTGLFDTLAGLPSSTSAEIAAAAGLDERYVREWLGGLVTGGVIDYDPAGATYALPAEHATFLTRAAGPDNMAAFAAYIPMLASVEDAVVDCFRHGGGVPYSSYPRLQELLSEDSGAVFDATLIDSTLPLVPGLVERLRDGIEVADAGCGGGHAVNLMAQAFPRSRFTGYDLSEQGIAIAGREAESLGLENASFEVKDVATLDEPGRFGLICAFDAIHDQARPAQVLSAIAAALAPGGAFLMVDFAASSNLEENVAHPLGPTLYTFSTLHCMTVSLAEGGAGLGTVWGEQTALRMLAEAGFGDVSVKRVEGDLFNNYYVARRGGV